MGSRLVHCISPPIFAAMEAVRWITEYVEWWGRSFRLHGIHSPFVFELCKEVIQNKKAYPEYALIEAQIEQLKNNQQTLSIHDLGAGSRWANQERKVADIARKGGSSRKYGRLLHRLVNQLQPETVLEIGTSLGMGTLYMAQSIPNANVISLEGDPQLAGIARSNFKALKMNQVEVVIGEFSETVPKALQQLVRLDFCFLDGNHQYEATIKYFEQCLEFAHEESVFVVDDIRWSKDMHRAWKTIVAHPKVTVSLDLFFMGIVFFRKKQNEQHFAVRFP